MANVIVLQPLGALIAGILILVMPRLLNFIVAIYLILIGILGLAPHFMRLCRVRVSAGSCSRVNRS